MAGRGLGRARTRGPASGGKVRPLFLLGSGACSRRRRRLCCRQCCRLYIPAQAPPPLPPPLPPPRCLLLPPPPQDPPFLSRVEKRQEPSGGAPS